MSGEWRPIESAPINQWIWVYERGGNNADQYPALLGDDGVWYEADNGMALLTVSWKNAVEPTHWAPLLDPPD